MSCGETYITTITIIYYNTTTIYSSYFFVARGLNLALALWQTVD